MTPASMAMIVSSMVTSTPERTWELKRYWPIVSHPNRLPVAWGCSVVEKTSVWMSMATRTARTAAMTHRHGCRTGTALIG